MMKEKNQPIIEELREIAPGLSDLDRNQPYTVPHNYFRKLPDRVLDRIHADEQKPSLWQRFGAVLFDLVASLRQPRYALAYASALALIVVAVIVSNPEPAGGLLAEISTEEALEYVMRNLDDYEPSEIYALGDPSFLPIGGLEELSQEELDETIDVLLDEMDTESLEELF